MQRVALNLDPAIRYQVITIVLAPDGHSTRFQVEIRYLNEPGLWYLSIFNASTDETICRYVPLIASYNAPNDLLKPFRHKGAGSIYCVPAVLYPSSENPGLDNLGEFELVWGDTDDT